MSLDKTLKDLEKDREKKVKKAEKESNFVEGIWLKPLENNKFRMVKVHVEFYPKTTWYVTNLKEDNKEIDPETRRLLTQEEWDSFKDMFN